MLNIKQTQNTNTAKYQEKKTILITGAGGAIGCHVLNKVLQETIWNVVITDSYRHKGDFDRVATVLDGLDASGRVTQLVHDLQTPFSIREIEQLKGVDYIVNLASLSDVQASIDDPAPFIVNNCALAVNMLELARQIEPEMFIQFSTDEVYGADTNVGYGHPEWDTILPSNPYSASKAAQEAIAIAYWRSYGVPVVITNTMNNFGEMQGASKYTTMIQSKLQKGEKVTVHAAGDGQIGSRFYIHSENTADAVLFLLSNTTAYRHQSGHLDRPDRYNIAGDRQVNNLELAQIVANLMDKELDYDLVNFHADQPGHDLHYGLTDDKMRDLGWVAPMSFEESMLRTITWQKQNPNWMK